MPVITSEDRSDWPEREDGGKVLQREKRGTKGNRLEDSVVKGPWGKGDLAKQPAWEVSNHRKTARQLKKQD